MTQGEMEFTARMRMQCEQMELVRCGASRLLQKLNRQGATLTCKQYLAEPFPSSEFLRLYALGRLDLSIEAAVLEQPDSPHFSFDEVIECRNRLEQYEYAV